MPIVRIGNGLAALGIFDIDAVWYIIDSMYAEGSFLLPMPLGLFAPGHIV